jgi:hypothetical protein
MAKLFVIIFKQSCFKGLCPFNRLFFVFLFVYRGNLKRKEIGLKARDNIAQGNALGLQPPLTPKG